jgi:hypothetical protein
MREVNRAAGAKTIDSLRRLVEFDVLHGTRGLIIRRALSWTMTGTTSS